MNTGFWREFLAFGCFVVPLQTMSPRSICVKDASGLPLEDIRVTVDDCDYITDEKGTAYIALDKEARSVPLSVYDGVELLGTYELQTNPRGVEIITLGPSVSLPSTLDAYSIRIVAVPSKQDVVVLPSGLDLRDHGYELPWKNSRLLGLSRRVVYPATSAFTAWPNSGAYVLLAEYCTTGNMVQCVDIEKDLSPGHIEDAIRARFLYKGRVLDSAGYPMPGAIVVALPFVDCNNVDETEPFYQTSSDLYGYFTMTGPYRNKLRVVALASECYPEPVDIDGPAFTGNITVKGEPVARGTVLLNASDAVAGTVGRPLGLLRMKAVDTTAAWVAIGDEARSLWFAGLPLGSFSLRIVGLDGTSGISQKVYEGDVPFQGHDPGYRVETDLDRCLVERWDGVSTSLSFGPSGEVYGCFGLDEVSSGTVGTMENEELSWSLWRAGCQPQFGKGRVISPTPRPGWGCELFFRRALDSAVGVLWHGWSIEASRGMLGALAAVPIEGIGVSHLGQNLVRSNSEGVARITLGFTPESLTIETQLWRVQGIAKLHEREFVNQYVVWLAPNP